MINLFVPYYIDKAVERRLELYSCLKNNYVNKKIDKIYLVSEDPEVNNLDPISSYCTVILLQERPTYNTMFELINSITEENDWNVLINSDIYTDETIETIKAYDKNCFLALSRWDVDKAGNSVHYNTRDSQDTWVFKGKARKMNADFYQGIAGCDNAIADRAERAGYTVINPSKTIKTYHLHNSGVRNYNPNNKVPKPYKMVPPTI